MASGDMFPEFYCCRSSVVLGHKPECINFVERIGQVCPDGGTCHHGCSLLCERVRTSSPLGWSGWDKWPPHIRREHDPNFTEGQMWDD